MSKTFGLAGALVLAPMVATPVHCAESDEPPVIERRQAQMVIRPLFDRLDCEGKGATDVDEVYDHFAQIWFPADLDQSGKLSLREYRENLGLRSSADAEPLFGHADTNGDSEIDQREFTAHVQRLIRILAPDGGFEISRADAGLPPDPYLSQRRRAAEPDAEAAHPTAGQENPHAHVSEDS